MKGKMSNEMGDITIDREVLPNMQDLPLPSALVLSVWHPSM